MTKQELQSKLVGKNLFFINQLVKQLGGSKKGSKSQDIEEILEFYDVDADKVVSAFETKEATNKNRFAKIKTAFHDIRTHWEEIVIFVAESPNVPDGVQKAVEILDSIIDGIFPIKDQVMQLTICEKIVDEKKFIETHELRAKIAIEVNKMFVERLKLYHIIKQNR